MELKLTRNKKVSKQDRIQPKNIEQLIQKYGLEKTNKKEK